MPKTISIAKKIFSTPEIIVNKSKSNFEKIMKGKKLEPKKNKGCVSCFSGEYLNELMDW